MKKVYDFLDKMGFSNKDFETLGLLIQIYSGIMLFFAIYALYALVVIGADFAFLLGQFDFGFGAFGGFLIGFFVFITLIIISLLVVLFLIGKKAKENYNKPEAKENLRKWAIALAVLVGINVLIILSSLTFGRFLMALIQVFIAILYFYFVERIDVFNSEDFVNSSTGTNFVNMSNDTDSKIEDVIIDNEDLNFENNKEFNTVEEEIAKTENDEGIIVNNEEIK